MEEFSELIVISHSKNDEWQDDIVFESDRTSESTDIQIFKLWIYIARHYLAL